jgi:hypothetical protein
MALNIDHITRIYIITYCSYLYSHTLFIHYSYCCALRCLAMQKKQKRRKKNACVTKCEVIKCVIYSEVIAHIYMRLLPACKFCTSLWMVHGWALHARDNLM